MLGGKVASFEPSIRVLGPGAEDEQEMVVDHFEMQKSGPEEVIFAQNEVGDCFLARISMRST